jgi:hypothetical protein
MLRLKHHAPRTTAVRARWLLDELSVSSEVGRAQCANGEDEKAEYGIRDAPWAGAAPTPVGSEPIFYESAAILLYRAARQQRSPGRAVPTESIAIARPGNSPAAPPNRFTARA